MLSVEFSTLHFLYASLFVFFVFFLLESALSSTDSLFIGYVWVSVNTVSELVYFIRDVIGLESWRRPFSQSDASRTNRKLIACVVPRLGQLACIFLEFSLATLLVTSWENFPHCIVETPASLSSNLARRNSRPL